MFTLSIVLNLHREGDLAAKTIDNLKNILAEPHKWETVEVIAVLDNPDALTKKIVQEHSPLFSKVEEVNYRDLGDSRNHGVDASTNEFIVFADGDDYCSHNMLQALYTMFYTHYSSDKLSQLYLDEILEKDHIVVVPKYYIEFPVLVQAHYYDSNDTIIKNNRFTHCYISRISTHKSLLTKNRIRKNTPPYGYEDWDLNNRLLNLGVKYKTAQFKIYYRKGYNDDSLLTKQIETKSIVRNSPIYNSILDTSTQSTDGTVADFHKPIFIKNKLKSKCLNKIYKDTIFNDDQTFLENYDEEFDYHNDIATWNIESLTNSLTPQSIVYDKLLSFLKNKEIIYIGPWVNLGGADKVTIEYIKSITDIYNAGLITTLNTGSRIDRITIPAFDMLSSSQHWNTIPLEDQLHILIKALINSDIKIIHIVNSNLALQIIKYYSSTLKEFNKKIIVSLFTPDYDWTNKQYHGYPVMYPEIFENADMVLSDNNYWYTYFKTINQDRDFKFKKLASPTDEIEMKFLPKEKPSKKILWASRICNQKLFDVFETIVHALPQYQFVIYGGQPEEENNKEILKRLLTQTNVEFRGEYQHIDELNLNEFDLYLFTSLFEGIPTIILDMAMLGIPIVSAEVGGISEVLGKEYPLLVKEPQNAEAYIEKINYFYKHNKNMHDYMIKIHDYIAEHHNEHTFQKEYRDVIEGVLDGHR